MRDVTSRAAAQNVAAASSTTVATAEPLMLRALKVRTPLGCLGHGISCSTQSTRAGVTIWFFQALSREVNFYASFCESGWIQRPINSRRSERGPDQGTNHPTA